jgi:hypothetical protein
MWSNNCSTGPNPRLATITYDSNRRQYVFAGGNSFGPSQAFYLTEAEMHAGNCSAMKPRWSTDLGYRYGGAEYIPPLDAMFIGYAFDQNNDLYFLNMSVDSSENVPFGNRLNTSSWWYDAFVVGEFYYQPNGTLWAMGDEYGPGMSVMYTLELGNNLTALQEGKYVKGNGVRTILPRTLRAISDGPVPTTLTKWRTGFAGSMMFLTPDNDLFEIALDTPAIKNITRLSQTVVAIESLGSWDQVFAIVNTSNTFSLARLNITTGALTNLASLPGAFQSLTMGSDGKMLALTRQNAANVTISQVTSAGVATEVAQFSCAEGQCSKVWSDGTFYYFSDPSGFSVLKRNMSDLSIDLGSLGMIDDCPDYDNAVGANDCDNLNDQFYYEGVRDMSYHAPTQGMLWASTAANGITNVYRHNMTINKWKTVVDFHHLTTDIAFFQYNRAWCNNRGDWNGEMCACDNAGIIGARCQTVLPAPVAPPVATPVAAPVAAPVATPVAASTAPRAAGAPTVVSDASSIVFSSLAFLSAVILAFML